MSKILVVGASGTVGSELSRLLAKRGDTVVRTTSRAPAQPDQVQVDLATRAGLPAAFQGVDRAFFLSPPGFVNQDELLAPLIEAAQSHRLKKVVLMTAMGANADDNAPMRKAEIALEKSGVPYNIVRPNWFMQNFNTFWLQGLREQGKIFLPVGTAKGSFIDARDIAAVADELLHRHEFDNRDFDLTGAEALDHDQVAAILSRETGRAIAFQDIPAPAMLDALITAQVPRPYAEFLVMILGFFKAGYSERITDSVPKILGRAPIGFAQYATHYRANWLV